MNAIKNSGQSCDQSDRQVTVAVSERKAKSWELTTTMNMARFNRYRGQTPEAHGLLTQTYNSFTEGFDSADLRLTKALLEEIEESYDAAN